MSDSRKGLIAGIKKLGPTTRFIFWATIIGLGLGFIYFIVPIILSTNQEARQAAAAERRHAEDTASLKEIKDSLKQKNESLESQLRARYPLGYALFYVSSSRLIYDAYNHSVQVDWSSTRITELTDTTITLRLPDWMDTKAYVKVEGMSGRLERKVGAKSMPFRVFDRVITLECLSTDNDGAIAVIGFSEGPHTGRRPPGRH